jgi:hypothetical protein
LKPIIFLPGDYVCHKGDVGMEMFIVSSGAVQVSDDGTTYIENYTKSTVTYYFNKHIKILSTVTYYLNSNILFQQ